MFNVYDQGILSPITAVHLIQTLIKGERVKKAACLCFDQAAIPTEQAFVGVFPTNNSAARLRILNSEKTANTLYQIEAAYLIETAIKDSNATIFVTPNTAYYMF